MCFIIIFNYFLICNFFQKIYLPKFVGCVFRVYKKIVRKRENERKKDRNRKRRDKKLRGLKRNNWERQKEQKKEREWEKKNMRERQANKFCCERNLVVRKFALWGFVCVNVCVYLCMGVSVWVIMCACGQTYKNIGNDFYNKITIFISVWSFI